MIKKLKIGLLIAVLSLVVGVGSASADDLTFSDNTIVSVNSNNYTIQAGSTATSLIVATTTLTVTVPASSTFVISSGDRYSLANDLGLNQTCTNSTNSVTVTGLATVVFTPVATACANSGGAPLTSTPPSSAGGSPSVSTNTTTTSITPSTTLTVTSVTPTTKVEGCGGRNTGFSRTTGVSCSGNVTSVTTGTSYDMGTKTLKNGSSGNDVKELQRVLNKILKMNLKLDGKLGPKTIAVIKTWQKAHGLKADGLVGAKTKAAMKAEAEKN